MAWKQRPARLTGDEITAVPPPHEPLPSPPPPNPFELPDPSPARRSHLRRLGVVTAALILLGTVAVFVWPTPWRYERVTHTRPAAGGSASWEDVWRINRLTGRAERVIDGTPEAIEAQAAGQPPPQDKPADPNGPWTREEKVSLAHFFRAHKRVDDGYTYLQKKFDDNRRQAPADMKAAGDLFEDALEEARAVREDVLAKAHPGLAAAFQDYLRYLEARCNMNVYVPWERWWEANRRDMRFPDDVPVRAGDGLTDEWARTYAVWRGVRMPRFVPE
jgi:hypothetical protein